MPDDQHPSNGDDRYPGDIFGTPHEPWLEKDLNRGLQRQTFENLVKEANTEAAPGTTRKPFRDMAIKAAVVNGFKQDWAEQAMADLVAMTPQGRQDWLKDMAAECAVIWSVKDGARADEFKEAAKGGGPTILGVVPKGEAALAHYVVTSGLANFEAYLEDDFLIDGLIPKNGFGALYGAPGCGKSILALTMSLCIATGRYFVGENDVKLGSVLYAALEGSKNFPNRAIASADANDINIEEAAKRFHLMRKVNLDLQSTDQDQRGILEVVRHLNAKAEAENEPPIRLIIVDTLNRVFGGGDENSGQDMGRLIGHCMTLQEETGAFVLLVHHSGKDVAKGMRGHSSLKGAIDVELRVDIPKADDGSDDTSTKRRTLTADKVRDGEDGVSFDFDIRSVPVGVMNEGTPLAKTKYSAAAVAVTTLGHGTKKAVAGRKPTAPAAFMTFIKSTIGQTNWVTKTPHGPGFPATQVLCVPETVVLKHYEGEFEATMPMTEDEPHAKRAARRKRFARDKVRNAMDALKGKVMKAADPDGKAYLWVVKDTQ